MQETKKHYGSSGRKAASKSSSSNLRWMGLQERSRDRGGDLKQKLNVSKQGMRCVLGKTSVMKTKEQWVGWGTSQT